MVVIHQQRRIGRVIVAGDLQYHLPVERVEADGALVHRGLLRLSDVEHAAEIERIREFVGARLLAELLELVEVFFLQRALLVVANLSRAEHLRGGGGDAAGNHPQYEDQASSSHKQLLSPATADQPRRVYRKTGPGYQL